MGRLTSFKSLAVVWAGLATAGVAGAVALQASYVPPAPPPPVPVASPVASPVAVVQAPADAAPPAAAPQPFENRSLLAVLPPSAPPRLPMAVHVAAATPLPVPPVPPAPVVHHPAVRVATTRPAVPQYSEAAPDYAEPRPWGSAFAYNYGRSYGYPYGPRRPYYGYFPGD